MICEAGVGYGSRPLRKEKHSKVEVKKRRRQKQRPKGDGGRKRGRKEAGVAELVPRVLWEELSKLRPHLAQWLPENTPGEHLLGLPPPLWACRQPRCPHSPLTATPPLCPGVRGSNPITKGVKASPERTPPPPPQEPWQLLPVTILWAGQVLLKPRSKVCLLGLWQQRAGVRGSGIVGSWSGFTVSQPRSPLPLSEPRPPTLSGSAPVGAW